MSNLSDLCTTEIDENGVVTARCEITDSVSGQTFAFEESIDSNEIAGYIADRFAEDPAIAGLGSWLSSAKNAAVKVAKSSAIKGVLKKAGPVVKALASEVPGGSTALALAMKTADTVNQARNGSKSALTALKNTAAKAVQGNPLAAEIMKTAKTLNSLQNIKEGKDTPDLAKRLALVERTLNPLLGNPQSPYAVSGAAHHPAMVRKAIAKKKAQMAKRGRKPGRGHGGVIQANRAAPTPRGFAPPPVVKKLPMPAPSPAPAAPYPETEEDLWQMEMEMEDQGYPAEEIVEEISGWREWLYSRPFRSPTSAALQGDLGAGIKLRKLYHDGLDTIASLRR